jgi:hypothetical protein
MYHMDESQTKEDFNNMGLLELSQHSPLFVFTRGGMSSEIEELFWLYWEIFSKRMIFMGRNDVPVLTEPNDIFSHDNYRVAFLNSISPFSPNAYAIKSWLSV